MEPKTLFRTLVIVTSCLSFVSFIIWGKQGIKSYMNVGKEIQMELSNIEALNNNIKELQALVQEWKSDNFFKEKAAREELLLGMPGETVYIIN